MTAPRPFQVGDIVRWDTTFGETVEGTVQSVHPDREMVDGWDTEPHVVVRTDEGAVWGFPIADTELVKAHA